MKYEVILPYGLGIRSKIKKNAQMLHLVYSYRLFIKVIRRVYEETARAIKVVL